MIDESVGWLKINFKNATLTHDTEFLGQMDPFCVIKFGKLEQKTKTH